MITFEREGISCTITCRGSEHVIHFSLYRLGLNVSNLTTDGSWPLKEVISTLYDKFLAREIGGLSDEEIEKSYSG
jgi:hypothetical protein